MLIVVQIVWVSNSMESKKKDFDAAVSIALERTIDAIAHEETYTQVISHFLDKVVLNPSTSNNQTHYSQRQTSREGVRYTTRSQERIPYSKLDSLNQNKIMPYANDSSVIEFLKKENEDDTVDNKTGKSRISSKNIIVERIVEDIFKIDLPIEQRVTIQQADTLIQNELKKSGISTPVQVAVIDENGNILFTSPEYFSLLNKSTETFQKQLFPTSPDSVEKYYLKAYFPERDFYILQSLWRLITITFVLILFILITFVTSLLIITKQKKTSEVRNAFVSNITHEFKTPIATISLAAQMLQDRNIPESAKNIPHLSQMVSTQSKKLTFLVEQILQMSIFDKGDFELKRKPVDIHEMIRKVLASFSLQIHDLNASVMCKLDANNSVIYTDELHFSNIISNLFDNALKYRKGTPSIQIITVNKDNGILVSFSDNGIGINKEFQKRVFEQFFRVPSGNVHDVKGFGLGLSYVKKIVDIMSGQIWLHSEPDKGSTFFIWMPLKNKINND